MLTSIYLSNEKVVLVTGKASGKKIKIKSYASRALPSGSMINGVITNEGAVKSVISRLCQEKRLPKKDVRLVIDSGSVISKLAVVPALSHKKLVEYTQNTFTDVAGSYEKLIYDYSVVIPRNPSGGGGTILCSAVESQLLESYMDLFKSIGVRLFSINTALNCIIKLSPYQTEISKKTYILCTIDGSTAVSSLFIQGQYSFTNRQRLFATRGSEESAAEFSGIISSLIQFNQSQKTGAEITDVYFCGLSSEEKELCGLLTNELSINACVLPNCAAVKTRAKAMPVFVLAEYLPVVGNLIIK